MNKKSEIDEMEVAENIKEMLRDKVKDFPDKSFGLTRFALPIQFETEQDFRDKIEKKFDDYLYDIKDKEGVNKKTYNRTCRNINMIKKALEFYDESKFRSAVNEIYKLLHFYSKIPYVVTRIDESPAFRGITRYNDNKGIKANSKLTFFRGRIGDSKFIEIDLLPHSFNSRERVSNNRFSMPGIPGMYLGLTSYACWIELGQPSFNIFNVSSYDIPKHMKILNLAIVQEHLNGFFNSTEKEQQKIIEFRRLVEFFPLVIASSFKCYKEMRNFKIEYVIPNLIMSALSENEIEGVAYLSKAVPAKEMKSNFPYLVNLAIPMRRDKSGNEYNSICRATQITAPTKMSDFVEKKNLLLSNNGQSFSNLWKDSVYFMGKYENYQTLIFSEFDDYLVGLGHRNVGKILNNESN